jgi:hypothetical protein
MGQCNSKNELKKLRYVGGTLGVAKHMRDASNGSTKTGTRLWNRAAHRALSTLLPVDGRGADGPCAWWITSPLGTPRGRYDEYSS